MSKRIKLLVVDDHFVVRSGVVASLALEDDLEVVAEAETGEQSLTLYREKKPDVVIMDLRLPGKNGIETTALLVKEFPGARVLIFTTYDGDEDIYRATQAGAFGYLLKSSPREELLAAIRALAKGERYMTAAISSRLAARVAGPDLSPRELEILQLLGRGLSNKEIGGKLFISEDTVKRHISNLFVKLKVNDRAQATAEAIRRGFIHLE
ncbi:MAG: response regulator containing a CheY-like receiver domain and an DNA-binding domain [Verrucomicrobia bacterium]|jgi:two-component system NarL family response regulator|nr:response regulator containing a CheY-like receiver domain and an DNA-binding domain [Verrucomicrobiota bacterium]